MFCFTKEYFVVKSIIRTDVCLLLFDEPYYRAFHRFGEAKFPDGAGSILGSSQFSILPKLPPKMMLSLKEVKIDSKISNLLC